MNLEAKNIMSSKLPTSLIVFLLLANIVSIVTLVNLIPLVKADGGVGKALSFNGIDNYVEVTDSADLKGMTELALEAWIKPKSFPQYAGIIGKWSWPTTMHYILGYFSGGKLYFYVGTDDIADNINVAQPSLDVWTHVVAVFKGGVSLEVFYNGVSQGSKTTTIANIGVGVEPTYIGKYSGYEFDGVIDEVRIYNRTLSPGEVLAHYNTGVGQYGRTETGLVAGWHFDEDVGTTASDYSGNNHDGTIYGAIWVDGHVPLPDIAIIDVTPASTKVLTGDTVDINVTAKNLGTPLESFTVTAYYDSNTIGTPQMVTSLAPNSNITLTFSWDTTGVPLGTYTIKANASIVQGETNFANNEMVDGTVWIIKLPVASFTYTPTPAIENYSTTFDATSSTPNGGDIANYTWNFGDSNITTTENPVTTHVYTSHGTYNVTLTVEDDEGLNNTTWQLVEVLRHDVAVIDVTPYGNWTYEGWPINVNVTIINEGNFTETVTVDLYYNITAGDKIGTKVIALFQDETKTLTFMWDTTSIKPCRNYTITAVVTISTESDTTDNVLESPFKIKVRMFGDIDGDDTIDIRDVAAAAKAFGSYPEHSKWNPAMDLNMDNKIDIRDIVIVAANFGKICP